MAKDIKKEIIAELNRRMDLLREHQYDQIQITGNEYSELNQALSKVIGAPLLEREGNQNGFWFPSLFFWESSGCALRTQPVIFYEILHIHGKGSRPKSLWNRPAAHTIPRRFSAVCL